MKNKQKFILIIFIFSILIILPTIKTKDYKYGDDTRFHMANISAIAKCLNFDNLLAQEPLPHIANNFGYGTRFFYPPLPHLTAAYIMNIFTNFNIDDAIILAMTTTQWIAIFASGVTFFLLAEKIFKNKKIAVVLSIFYMTAPYHLSEIFIRGAFSEMFIPVAIPLIILGLLYLIEKDYKLFLIYFVFGYVLSIFSHLVMTVYMTIIITITFFTIYFKKIFTKKNIMYLFFATLLVICITSSFWMPMLEMKAKAEYGVFIKKFMLWGELKEVAIPAMSLISGDIIANRFNYIRFELQIFVTVMCIISILIFFIKKLWKERIWWFLLIFTAITAIMVTPLFPWEHINGILQSIQFPWRLVIYVALGAILVAGITLKLIENKKGFNLVCVALLLMNFFSFCNFINSIDRRVEETYIDYSIGLGVKSEYLPKRILQNMNYYYNRSQDIIVLQGEGKIEVSLNKLPDLNFKVNNINENMTIELPRVYYVGYELKCNNRKIELSQSDNGFLKATLETDGEYKLTYKKTMITKLGNVISIVSFASFIVFIYLKNKKINNRQ